MRVRIDGGREGGGEREREREREMHGSLTLDHKISYMAVHLRSSKLDLDWYLQSADVPVASLSQLE